MIRLTILAGAYDKEPRAQDDYPTFSEAADQIAALVNREHADKRAMIAFHFGRLASPYNVNANVIDHTALAIDVDRGDPSDVAAHLESAGVEALIYASSSDDPSGPRNARKFRVCAPLSRPILPNEIKRVRRAFAEAIGIGPGQGVETAEAWSQIFFVGRLSGTPARQVWRTNGGPVDVDALPEPRAAWKPERPADVGEALPRLDVPPDARTTTLVDALRTHWEPPGAAVGRRQVLRGLGGYLARRGWDDSQIAVVASKLDTARPEAERARLMVEAARQARRDPEGTAGWAALATWSPEAARVIEATAKDPREPAGFAGVWSDWWVRYLEARPERAPERAPEPAPAPTCEAITTHGALVLDTTRQGTPRAHAWNVALALDHVFGERIRYDEMRGRVLCAGIDRSVGNLPDGLWTDTHTIELQIFLSTMQLHVSKHTVSDVVSAHARRNAFNPLRDWLEYAAGQWDGVARVDQALTTYWGAVDAPATRATSRVLMLSLAARGLRPGCKVDTCPILVGEQGIRKSSSLEVLAGGPDRFSDSKLPIGDKEALQMIRGKWIWELAELASIFGREIETVRAFLSARFDTFRSSYGQFTEDVPRTCVFVGTSNRDDVIRDPKGERRYLPVHVHRVDIDALAADREQLLGEAATRVIRGEAWWPVDGEKAALHEAGKGYSEHDAWDDMIAGWLDRRERTEAGRGFTASDLFDELTGAIRVPGGRITRGDMIRAGQVLGRLGYSKVREGGGARRIVWRKN